MPNHREANHTANPGSFHRLAAACALAVLGIAAVVGWQQGAARPATLHADLLIAALVALPLASRRDWLKGLALAFCVVIALLILPPLEPRVFSLGYDIWTHAAMIDAVRAHGLFPGDAHLAGGPTPPFLSLTHWAGAAAVGLTGVPALRWWHWATVFTVVLWLATNWFLAWAWLRSRTLAFVAVVVGGVPSVIWWFVIAYPFTTSLIWGWIAIACRIMLERGLHEDSGRRPPWGWMAATGLAVGIATCFHLVGGFCVCLLLGIWELLTLLSMKEIRRWPPARLACRWGWLPLGLAIGSPFLVNTLRQLLGAADRNPFQYELHPGLIQLGQLGPLRILVMSPKELFYEVPWAAAAVAGLGLLVLARRVWRNAGAERAVDLLVLVLSVAPVILTCTPLLSLLVPLSGSYHTLRLVRYVPFTLLAVAVLAPMLVPPPAAAGPRRLLPVLAMAVVALGLLIPVSQLVAVQYWAVPRCPNVLAAFGRQLQALEPELHGKTVLTDLETAYGVPALTGANVVAVDSSHVQPYVDPTERIRDVLRFCNGSADDAEISRTLDRWQVDYVLLNDEPYRASTNPEFRRIKNAYTAEAVERLLRHRRLRQVPCLPPFRLLKVLPAGQPATGGG